MFEKIQALLAEKNNPCSFEEAKFVAYEIKDGEIIASNFFETKTDAQNFLESQDSESPRLYIMEKNEYKNRNKLR